MILFSYQSASPVENTRVLESVKTLIVQGPPKNQVPLEYPAILVGREGSLQSFCEEHGKGANLHRLEFFHQRVGTCIVCEQYVCERCWILNPNGDIVCLRHLDEKRKSR